jgi:pre-mRNA-splicing factor CDC5/CEF1
MVFAHAADTILLEAQNIIALNTTQTPLKGGENTPLHHSDFSGATPARVVVQTPNVLMTPRTAASGGTTPLRMPSASGKGSAPSRTPLRDGLHINDASMSGDMPESVRLQATKKQVTSSLMSLPAPKNQFKVVISDTATSGTADEDDDESVFKVPAIPDTADIVARRNAAIQAQGMQRFCSPGYIQPRC